MIQLFEEVIAESNRQANQDIQSTMETHSSIKILSIQRSPLNNATPKMRTLDNFAQSQHHDEYQHFGLHLVENINYEVKDI